MAGPLGLKFIPIIYLKWPSCGHAHVFTQNSFPNHCAEESLCTNTPRAATNDGKLQIHLLAAMGCRSITGKPL
jgi:hypothetical protein